MRYYKMKITKILMLLFGLIALPVATSAQMSEVKLNVAAAAVTIFNPSVEFYTGDSSAVTFDFVQSFAKEDFMNTGYPFLFSMGSLGYRRYTRSQSHDGFFYGGDLGMDMFRMNKNVIPFIAHDNAETHYDVGYGYCLGVTLGYKYKITHRLSLEASLSAGWHYSMHEYYNQDGVRQYDFNISAEWTPYKAGIYLNYSLGK